MTDLAARRDPASRCLRRPDGPLVVGDCLGDHGHSQKWNMYQSTVHVPALVFGPGRIPQGRRVADNVALFDFAPTILEFAGIEVPPWMEATSLRPYFADGPALKTGETSNGARGVVSPGSHGATGTTRRLRRAGSNAPSSGRLLWPASGSAVACRRNRYRLFRNCRIYCHALAAAEERLFRGPETCSHPVR